MMRIHHLDIREMALVVLFHNVSRMELDGFQVVKKLGELVSMEDIKWDKATFHLCLVVFGPCGDVSHVLYSRIVFTGQPFCQLPVGHYNLSIKPVSREIGQRSDMARGKAMGAFKDDNSIE